MMKCILVTLLLAFSTFGLHAQTHAKLSPATRRYLAQTQQEGSSVTPKGYVYKKASGGITTISAFIKVSNSGEAEQGLRNLGVLIGTKAGAVWTVRVPVDKVVGFTNLSGIIYIQLDEPAVLPHMDVARKLTRVDSVQKGLDLPMPYTGKGVIVGIIDFGFDYNNPLFYDTLGAYRVRKVWELNGTGTPPAGYAYGRELSDTNAIKAATTDNAKQTHGTAVAGMAIGSGIGGPGGSNLNWRGMAYDAQAVLVGVRRDSIASEWMQGGFTDFADGIAYIFNYATSVSKPAVINISWGSQSGPHDGSTLFNEACDALSGAGKIIVMSAGNEGTEHIHLNKTFTAVDTQVSTFLTFSPANYQRTWVDVWGDSGKVWCADVQLYRNGLPVSVKRSVCLDNSIHSAYLTGTTTADTCFIEFINSTSEFNNKPRSTITVFNKTGDTARITLRAASGSINAWNEYYYYGYDYGYQSSFSKLGVATATEGDSLMCASDMGAAKSVLLVGAYVSRNSWGDINGNSWAYNSTYAPLYRLASFSSRGPLVDGRIKPDITAPGLTVATAFSSYDTAYTATGTSSVYVRTVYTHPVTGRKYYYAEFSGTSAASPAASGIVALMLQLKPTLTPAECKNILFQTAIQDVYTGTLPAAGLNTWGHGKINAYGAMKMLAQSVGVTYYAGTGKGMDCTLFPNPGSGTFLLHYNSGQTTLLNVDVFNSVGSLVRRIDWPVEAGNNVLPVSTANLASGNYVLRIAGKDGTVSIKTTLQ